MKPYIQSGNRSGVLLQLWSMNGIKIRLVAYLYVKSTRTRWASETVRKYYNMI